MDQDQTPINGKLARQRGLSASLVALGWGLRERLIWPLGDAFKAVFEVVRWPFERLAWALQRALVWPLKDRTASLSGQGRIAASAGAAVGVVAIGVAVVLLAGSGGSGGKPAAARVAIAPKPAVKTSPSPEPKPPARTLHGAAPVFKAPAKSADPAEVDHAEAVKSPPTSSPSSSAAAASASAATAQISSRPSSPTATATSSAAAEAGAIPGPEAGAKAIAVAERFSQAFVVYETGGEESAVRQEFAQTTTPELAKALLKRPPRLPADVEVPKAKVVNVVPGPSREGVYTLSVSLLRVGVTSELRLEMEKLKKDGWRVTNVLG
jgi:hypothetical protein